jgi:hypothetical protein
MLYLRRGNPNEKKKSQNKAKKKKVNKMRACTPYFTKPHLGQCKLTGNRFLTLFEKWEDFLPN